MVDSAEDRAALEATIRAALEAGDLERAVTLAIERYGPGLHGYLRAIARDDDLAAEAFAETCERVWRHLPGFRWDASLYTWAYHVARTALYRLRDEPHRRPERNLPLSLVSSIEAIVRTPTETYARTDVKDAMRALRDALDPLDHEILILRLDRAMSWKDIARALAAPDDTAATLDQRAAALRKRFERTKARLKELALAHGLLEE